MQRSPNDLTIADELNAQGPKTLYARVREQITRPALIRTFIILCIYGFIPFAWVIGVPFLFIYGIIKRKNIANELNQKLDAWVYYISHFAEESGKKLGKYIAEQPLQALIFMSARVIGTLFMLYSGFNVWNLMAVYAIWRFSDARWKQAAIDNTGSLIRFNSRLVGHAQQGVSFRKQLFILGALTLYFGIDVYLSGFVNAFILTFMRVAQTFAIMVGVKAIWEDITYLYKHPIKIFTENPGKFIGVWWGREFAYRLFSGRIDGNLGPALGFVENRGAFSAIFSSFFSPRGWFIMGDSPLGLLLKRFMTAVHSIFSGVLFTSNMHTQGNFYGVIGPGPEQIYTLMILGCLIGYLAERFADRLSQSIASEPENIAKHLLTNSRSYRQSVYGARWHMAYVCLATPLLLVSNSGPQLLAMAGNSVFGAIFLTAGLLGTSLVGIYGAIYLIKYLKNYRSNKVEATIRENYRLLDLLSRHELFAERLTLCQRTYAKMETLAQTNKFPPARLEALKKAYPGVMKFAPLQQPQLERIPKTTLADPSRQTDEGAVRPEQIVSPPSNPPVLHRYKKTARFAAEVEGNRASEAPQSEAGSKASHSL